jgi:hypothetical protein
MEAWQQERLILQKMNKATVITIIQWMVFKYLGRMVIKEFLLMMKNN